MDYYQLAFAWLHTQLPSNLTDIHEMRASFWNLVPDGRYDPVSAQDLVRSYALAVEARLADEIKKHSIAFWLHVYRRLSPHSIGADRTKATTMIVRQILEASFQKYGLTADCLGIGWSDDLKDEEVLSGVPEEYKAPYIIKQYLAGPRQHLLRNFGISELIQFYECEKLAYELWRCGATLRITSKGAPLVVDDTNEACFFDDRSPELNELVTNYDNRGNLFVASATATVFGSDSKKLQAEGTVFLAQYNIEHQKASIYSALFKNIKLPKDLEFNFDWIPFHLGEFCKAHSFFTAPFHKKHGFRYEVSLMIVMSLFYRISEAWVSDEKNLYQSFQRAYTGPSTTENIRSAIDTWLKWSAEKLNAAMPSDGELERAISFLTLTDQKRAGISLLTGGPNYLFLPAVEGRFLVDFAWLTASLNYLFMGVPFPVRDLKGKMLETLIGGTRSSLPDGESKGFDGQSREIDAAFERGKILVIVECKANARSIGYERGDLAALNFRRGKFEEALNQVDDKADWLSLHSKGANYDIRQYEGILPVVVTPFKEFMPSLNGRYWIEKELPRVLTPDELERLLGDKNIEEIARRCPSTKYIPLSLST
jgi:hypothetical protein